MLSALGESRPEDVVVLPSEALNADDVFIDGLPRSELEAALAPARVVSGYEVTEALSGEIIADYPTPVRAVAWSDAADALATSGADAAPTP